MARTVALSGQDVAAHITLAANEATRVVFPDDVNRVEVLARDGSTDVWYTLDSTTPVPNGTRCYVMPAGAVGADSREVLTAGPTVVTLLAAAPTLVTVQRATGGGGQ